MEYKNFSKILNSARSVPLLRRGVVAGAAEQHVLEAVFEARAKRIAFPVLVGDAGIISSMVRFLGHNLSECEIVGVEHGEDPAQRAVGIIASGGADFLIKGKIETKDLLKPVLDRKNGLLPDGPPPGESPPDGETIRRKYPPRTPMPQ